MNSNVRIVKRFSKKKDGTFTYYLEYQIEGNIHRETTHLSSKIEDSAENKRFNKSLKDTAEKYRLEKELDLIEMQRLGKNTSYEKADFFTIYKNFADGQKENTKIVYYNSLKSLKAYAKKDILQIKEITPAFIENYYNHLKKNKYSTSTIATYIYPIKKVFNILQKKKKLFNPFAAADIDLKSKSKERNYLTEDEVIKLNKLKDNKNLTQKDRQRLYVALFAIYTGLRYSDLRALKWSNIQDHKLIFTAKKTGETIYNPLNKPAILLLDQLAKEYSPENDIVFNFNLPSYSCLINTTVEKLMNLAKIDKHISMHCFRHTHAIIYLENEGDVFTLKDFLGHSSIKTTQIYAKITDRKKAEAVKNFPNFEGV